MCVATLGTLPYGGGVLKASSQMPPTLQRGMQKIKLLRKQTVFSRTDSTFM